MGRPEEERTGEYKCVRVCVRMRMHEDAEIENV